MFKRFLQELKEVKNSWYKAIDDISNKKIDSSEFEAYVVKDGKLAPFTLKMAELTPDEREIILKGCLINYNRK